MLKTIFAGVLLLATAIVFATSLLFVKLWSGKPFQSIWADRKQLFLLSLKLAIALLVTAAIALVIANN
jgi:hypothetical protein